MSLNKRRRILRQEEIDRLLEESEGDSDLEMNLLGEDDGTGWEDSDMESVGELEENINNADSDGDDPPPQVIPIIMRNRRMPRQNRAVQTFDDCLDENSYEILPITDVSREYTVTVKKGNYAKHFK